MKWAGLVVRFCICFCNTRQYNLRTPMHCLSGVRACANSSLSTATSVALPSFTPHGWRMFGVMPSFTTKEISKDDLSYVAGDHLPEAGFWTLEALPVRFLNDSWKMSMRAWEMASLFSARTLANNSLVYGLFFGITVINDRLNHDN